MVAIIMQTVKSHLSVGEMVSYSGGAGTAAFI
jgi:hypothetical protein